MAAITGVSALAGCGNDDAADETAPVVVATTPGAPSTVTTAPPPSDPPPTTAPETMSPATSATPVTTGPARSSDAALSARIESVLTDAIAPGSISWDLSGVDAPATAAVAAVRIPGRDDVLVAVGQNVDGSPAEADAPFFAGTLTESLVRTVAFQLVDEGVLDPDLDR